MRHPTPAGAPPPARSGGRKRPGLQLAGVALTVVGLVGCGVPTGSADRRTPGRSDVATSPSGPSTLPAAESGVLPWALRTPVSREVVLPGPGGAQLTVVGGLRPGGASTGEVLTVNTATGAVARSGSLLAPLHDASGAVLRGRATVFGGGTSASSAGVQGLPSSGTAAAIGTLPRARSDSASVSLGTTSYLLGGYDGSHMDPQVLATTDGTAFTVVAQLPVPVRYPAVAALGGSIYVFGGQTADGEPTSAVQRVDPKTRSARVVGRLPEPVTGASAAALEGVLYICGGETSAVGGTTPNPGIWAYDPATGSALAAGRLRVPVSHAGIAVLGQRAWVVGGETATGPVGAVQMLTPNVGFGAAGAPGAGSPFFGGQLLIADAGANRLLLVNSQGQVTWSYPSPTAPAPRGGFFYPDDAFFVDHGTAILMNMESYDEIIKVAYPSGKLLWSYGHPGVAGSAPGYLNTPDDVYQLKSGQLVVADIGNCRLLILNPSGTRVNQIGTTGSCVHRPPNHLGAPNGDTPLANGNLLISEINGAWISEYTRSGHLVWTTHLPLIYPSDPQQIGPNRYLVAGYTSPGVIMEFNRQGQVLYRYAPSSGPGSLDHPSLVELLPSGALMLNDDKNNRMLAIDPATGATVWQYGVTGVAGTSPGLLTIPDGFDVLMANGTTPTHPTTG